MMIIVHRHRNLHCSQEAVISKAARRRAFTTKVADRWFPTKGATARFKRGHRGLKEAMAFDLIELNGDDLRRDPLEIRKATLADVLARVGHGIWFNDSKATARPCSPTRARWAWRASCGTEGL